MLTWYQNLRTKTCSLRLRAFTPGLTPGVLSPISDSGASGILATDAGGYRRRRYRWVRSLLPPALHGTAPLQDSRLPRYALLEGRRPQALPVLCAYASQRVPDRLA